MKVEIFSIYDPKKLTCAQMGQIILDYFMDYWNNRRICSANGGLPPAFKREVFFMKEKDQVA